MLSQLSETIGAFVGRVVFITVIALILFNGVLMLASPRRWFGIPKWLRFQGSLPWTGQGGRMEVLQVRLLGAALVGSIAWLVLEVLIGGQ